MLVHRGKTDFHLVKYSTFFLPVEILRLDMNLIQPLHETGNLSLGLMLEDEDSVQKVLEPPKIFGLEIPKIFTQI